MHSTPRPLPYYPKLWAFLVFAGLSTAQIPAQAPAESPAQPIQNTVLEAVPAKPEADASQGQSPAPASPPGAPEPPILAEAPVQATLDSIAPSPSAGKISYSSCTVEGAQVAITFDDGPHSTNTPRLLEILKQKGVKATFFVVGRNAAEYPEILKRIVAEGHELANHSFSHPVLASLSESALREQLDQTHQAVLKATGVSMKLMRPPYGALSEPQRRWVHSHYGYRVILWDVDPLDWKVRDAAKVEGAIVSKAHAGSIILAHDIHKTTIDAVPGTLDQLLQKGLKFVTVSELLALDKPAAAKPAPVKADAVSAPAKSEPKPKPEKSGISSIFRSFTKSSPPTPKTAASEKVSQEKRAEKNTEKTAERTPEKNPSPGGSSNGGKKFSQLTEEELKKKWLESLKR